MVGLPETVHPLRQDEIQTLKRLYQSRVDRAKAWGSKPRQSDLYVLRLIEMVKLGVSPAKECIQ